MESSDVSRFSKPYHFKCTQCGNCCRDRNTIVNLTYADILRLQWELGLDLEGLLGVIGFYKFENPPSHDELKKMVLPPIQTEQGLAFVGLRKKADGSCIFLGKDNRCKIYTGRPNICRTFPFHFHSTTHTGEDARLEISMSLAEKAKEFCPGFDLAVSEINGDEWMGVGKDTITNILKDHKLIQEWNTACDQGKITPIAENYLRVIMGGENKDSSYSSGKVPVGKNLKDAKIKGRRNYAAIAKGKLQKQEK